jgi:glycosyltransferase involved in cell wall biosynthesis
VARALMRVLAVSTLAEVAGGELMLLRVLPELQRRGLGIRLGVPGPGRLVGMARKRGIQTSRIPLGPPDRRTPAALAGLILGTAQLLRSDVAWLNGLPAQRLVPALALTRRRAVLRVNNPLPEAPAAWGRPGFWRVVAAVTADSQASANECVAAGAPADRVRVVLPPAWDEGPPPAAAWSEGSGLRVGFVGTIEPRKGVLELIVAAGTFLGERPGATLTVIGESPPGRHGDYGEAVRAAAATSGVQDRIEFRGYVEDAGAEISGFDLLAVPSQAEPFGTVAAEAAARGVPVVACAVGGLVEVVGDGGLLVPPGDPVALAGAVGELLDDPGRRRALSQRALAGAGRFDPVTAAEAMEALLRQAAEPTR